MPMNANAISPCASSYVEALIGDLYNKSSWANTSDFNAYNLTPTISSNRIVIPSSPSDFNNVMILNEATGKNSDENLTITAEYIVDSIGTGLSIGRGGAINSAFQYDSSSDSMRIWSDSVTYYGEVTSLGLGTQAGDSIRQTIQQRKNVITYSVQNLTRGTSAQNSVTCNMGSTKNFRLPNTSWQCLWSHGGQKTLTKFVVNSASLDKPNIVCIGDSKTAGFAADSITARWPALVNSGTVSVYAGDGDVTADTLAGINYVVARAPQKAILFIGCNDIRAAISSGTWQSNYTSIVNALTGAGAQVVHVLPAPEASLDQSALKSWIQTTYPNHLLIDPSEGWVNATHLSADNVHPNATGHAFIASKIRPDTFSLFVPSNTWTGYVADFDARFRITNTSGKASQADERYGNGMSASQGTDANRPSIASTSWGQALQGNGTSTTLAGNTAFKSILRNTASVTIYALAQFTHGSLNSYLLDVSTSSGGGSRATFGGGNSIVNLYGGNRVGDTGSAYVIAGPRAGIPYPQPVNFVLNLTTGAMEIYRNNVLIAQNTMGSTGTIPNTAALNAALLSASSGTAGWFSGSFFRLIVCNGAHDEATRANNWASILTEYGKTCAVKNGTPNLIVQLQGDSITQGNILPAFAKDLGQQLWEALGSRSDRIVVNYGRSGAKATDGNTDRPSQIDILPIGSATNVVYVQFYGPNDVVAALSGATIYANEKTGFQAAKVARPGLKTILCTPIAYNGGTAGQRTELVNLRTQILANAVSDGASRVSDFGGLANFDVTNPSVASNTTNYIDGLHPTELGTGELAQLLATDILAII